MTSASHKPAWHSKSIPKEGDPLADHLECWPSASAVSAFAEDAREPDADRMDAGSRNSESQRMEASLESLPPYDAICYDEAATNNLDRPLLQGESPRSTDQQSEQALQRIASMPSPWLSQSMVSLPVALEAASSANHKDVASTQLPNEPTASLESSFPPDYRTVVSCSMASEANSRAAASQPVLVGGSKELISHALQYEAPLELEAVAAMSRQSLGQPPTYSDAVGISTTDLDGSIRIENGISASAQTSHSHRPPSTRCSDVRLSRSAASAHLSFANDAPAAGSIECGSREGHDEGSPSRIESQRGIDASNALSPAERAPTECPARTPTSTLTSSDDWQAQDSASRCAAGGDVLVAPPTLRPAPDGVVAKEDDAAVLLQRKLDELAAMEDSFRYEFGLRASFNDSGRVGQKGSTLSVVAGGPLRRL